MEHRSSSTHLTLALLFVGACSDRTTPLQAVAGSAPEMNMQAAMPSGDAAPMKSAEAGHAATMTTMTTMITMITMTGASGAMAVHPAANGGSSGRAHDAGGTGGAVSSSGGAGAMSAGSGGEPAAGASGNAGNAAPPSSKLDTDHVAVGGHSAGSLATFVVASDPRITTTVHMSGGTFDPHTDNQNLRAPALFLCGQVPMGNDDGLTMGDLAAPNCEIDFMDAKTPVFYGSLMGGAHVTLIDVDGIGPPADDPKKLKFIGGMIGWLRWKLAGDESLESMFVGSDCTLCRPDSGWTVKQKDL